jgi:hypothetical protein
MTAAGGYSQGKTQQNFVNAQNTANQKAADISKRARDAENLRQAGFEADSTAAWEDTLGSLGRDDLETDRDAVAQNFIETINADEGAAPSGFLLSGQDNASEVVKSDIAKRANVAAVDSRSRIQALAKMQGVGSASGNRGQALSENGDFVSVINGLRRGSLGTAQQEQSIPGADVTPGSNLLGQILSGAGTALGASGGDFSSLGLGGGPTRPMARPSNLITG